MSWKTHGATPRDNTQKVANATVTKKSNMPSKSEPLIHVCLYKRFLLGRNTWHGTAQGLFAPPPIGGTAQNRAAHGDSDPPPPYAYCTVHWHCTLSLHTAHCHCTLSLYTVTVHCHCALYSVHCTLYTVLYTLYSPRSHRMYPHTQYVRHKGQDSTLALYTVTLQSLYALTVHCHCTLSLYTVSHCTLSLYTVTVHCHCKLGAIFLEGVDGILSPALCSPLTPPPPPTAAATVKAATAAFATARATHTDTTTSKSTHNTA